MKIHNLKYLKQKRKYLRNNLTPAEATLWNFLKSSKLAGRKFRRQHSIGNFIVDFYCPTEKLVIELDGDIHDDDSAQFYDDSRTEYLVSIGVKVIRFENIQVFETPELVCEEIKKHFNFKDHPRPS